MSKINKQMLVAMLADGLEVSEIADRFNCTTRAVNYAIESIDRAARFEEAKEAGKEFGFKPKTQDFGAERFIQNVISKSQRVEITIPEDRIRLRAQVENGVVIIGSDAHYLPGEPTIAHRALVELTKQLAPVMVIQNGDLFDFASISRHPPLGWSKKWSVKEELEAVQTRLQEIEDAAPAGCKFVRTQGNHDARFDQKLAAIAGQYEGVYGFALADHLPGWIYGVGLHINEKVMVKHRWKGGIHATHNNTVQSGMSVITGHLHSLKVTPWTDYTGTRYGVDTGTLADVNDLQFEYAEDNPRNWRSGFAVLTFKDGRLLQPELCQVEDDGHAYFRGQVIA